jgi:hypothetical protein
MNCASLNFSNGFDAGTLSEARSAFNPKTAPLRGWRKDAKGAVNFQRAEVG